MKNKPFLILIFFCILMIRFSNVWAHPGGHYSNNDYFNTWQLANGNILKGNFLKGDPDTILLEQPGGKLAKVAINLLSAQHKKLARFKIKHYREINEGLDSSVNFEQEQNSAPFIFFLSSMGFIFLTGILFLIFKKTSFIRIVLPVSLVVLVISTLYSFSSNKNFIPNTNLDLIDASFAPYKPHISTSHDDQYYYVSSNGLPEHPMMEDITSWQQQVPLPQDYTGRNSWSSPLQPVYANEPISTHNNFMRGAIALAVNGVPIFNALNNRGDDAYLVGELDKWGGHCGRADDYHYHIAPLHLATVSGLKPIAFALDGFAIYGTKEPDGSTMKPLDLCHGHVGSDEVYHYHGTMTYPYTIAFMKGKVTLDESKPAPENQITPQAMATPIRPPGRPLRGASITGFVKMADNAYSITYLINKQYGHVNYKWDQNTNYTFISISPEGNIDSTVYHKRR